MLKQTDTAETPQTAEAPEFTKLAAAFRPVRPELAFQFEHFAGRGSEEVIHNAEGCQLRADMVLMRAGRVEPFTLAIKLGDRWFEVAKVALDDPAIQALPLIEYPPTPHELEQQRRKDEAEAERIEIEAARRRDRERIHEERRRKAEEHRQRVVEENRRRLGM